MSASNQIINILKSNVTQIMAAIFMISLIIIAITLMFKKGKEDRAEFFKQILALVIAAFIVISASSISGTLNYIIGNMSYEVNGSRGEEHETIEIEEQEERGFWQKGIDQIFIYAADAAETAKKLLVGSSEDMGIRAILHKATMNPLANYNMPTKGGGELNLYSLLLNSTSFLTFLMIINTAYKLMKYSWNPSKREEVINAMSKWAYIIVIMASIPALFAAATKIMDMLMNIFRQIDLDYTLHLDMNENISQYGILWAVLKIIMAYMEFKVYVVMIYRVFVINMYYITSPIAIYLWGISDNFTAANSWLNGILVNVFSPLAYELTFIMGMVLMNTFYKGNEIASFITILFALTIADVIKGIINYKISGNILGGMQDVNNVTRGIFSTAMTAIAISRLGKNIANSKLFKSPLPDNKIPPTSGKTFPDNERGTSGNNSNTFRNTSYNNNTQSRAGNAEQLGKPNISNKGGFSSNQSNPTRNNSFSQGMAREAGINYKNGDIKQFDNMISNNSNKTEGSILSQKSNQANINNSNLGRQPELKKQSENSDQINSFGFESPGYFASSNPKTLDKQSENTVSQPTNKVPLTNEVNKNTPNLKEDLSSVKKGIQTAAKGVPIAAGIGATIATGNPIIGLAASKGAQLSMNAAGNIIKGGTNAVKQTFESAKAATNLTKNTVQMINKAIKSNSDFKPYRRD